MDGRTDGRTDARTDNVKTVYPLQTKFAGGIIKNDVTNLSSAAVMIDALRVNVHVRPPDKCVHLKITIFIFQKKHLLWELKRTISLRRFFFY